MRRRIGHREQVILLSITEQTYQQDLERLKSLRYMDDDFMTVCLADNFEGVEDRKSVV